MEQQATVIRCDNGPENTRATNKNWATQWVKSYHHDRPNMALGGFTVKQHLAMAA